MSFQFSTVDSWSGCRNFSSSARTSNGSRSCGSKEGVDAGVAGRGCKGDLGRSSGVRTNCGWAESVGSIDGAGWDDRETSSGRPETETAEIVELRRTRRGVGGRDASSTSSRTR